MTKAARARVTLTGSHSLAPASVKDACRDIGDMLSRRAIPHTVQSPVLGIGPPDGDAGGLREHVRARVEESTFDIRWTTRLPADVPDAMAAMVGDCLQIIDDVNVQASVEADMVSMTLPRIGSGPLAYKLTALAFELEPPKIPQKPPDGHETRFFGMAVLSGKKDGSVVIFSERKSVASGVSKSIEYSLKALSSYCEACVN